MKKSPLQIIKQKHDTKTALVDALVAKLERAEGESDEDFKARLLRVSNKKLLRLDATFTRFKAAFADKDALVNAVIEAKSPRQKNDATYRAKLGTWPVTKLMDAYESAKKG